MNEVKQTRSIDTLMTKRSRKITFILAVLVVVLIIGAIIVGVNDNVPGIILGYIAATLLFIALTYTWREMKKFLILTGASLVGFFVFVFLHNAFYGLGIITSDISIVSHFMEVSHVAFFCLAIFICPPSFVVGAVGSIVFAVRKLRGR